MIDCVPYLMALLLKVLSRRGMAVPLNDLGITAPCGGAWSLGQVQRLVHYKNQQP